MNMNKNINDLTSLIGVPTFDYTLYEENCGREWQNWLRSFQWYLKSSHIEDGHEKFVRLMFLAGRKVQELYETLPEDANTNQIVHGPLINGFVPQLTEYDKAVAKLNEFFLPKTNSTYERHILRQIHQEKGEKIDIFVMRLRKQAERCDLGDKIGENIKDQIIEKCHSTKLRRELLKIGDGSLEKVLKAAKVFESIAEQEKTFGTTDRSDRSLSVYAIKSTSDFRSKQEFTHANECNSCGFLGHRAFDGKCPAKGKKCNKCGGGDHFSRKCHSRKRPIVKYSTKEEESPEKKQLKIQDKRVEETIKYINSGDYEDDYEF